MVSTCGEARGLLHGQHHATCQGSRVGHGLLVHSGLDDHFGELSLVFSQCDVQHDLFDAYDEDLLVDARLVANVGGFDSEASAARQVYFVVAVEVGHSPGLEFDHLDGGADKGFARDCVLDGASQSLSVGLQ